MFDAVVFDFGMVLSSPPTLFPALGKLFGVPADTVARHYEQGRHAWDAGGPASDYWAGLMKLLGVEPTPELMSAALDTDLAAWLRIRDDAWALLRDCRAAGHRVAVLSNAPNEMAVALETAPWRADVDDLFVSAPLGLIKPEPAIYAHVAERLGERLAFVDDRAPNVEAARAAGWETHLWVDDAHTRAWLTGIGVLPAPAIAPA